MTEEIFDDPSVEIAAMGKVADSLINLSPQGQARVLSWAVARFGVHLEAGSTVKTTAKDNVTFRTLAAEGAANDFGSFAELIESVELKSNADRALFAAYWLQEFEGDESFDGRSVNKLLKEHGIDVSNVTNALASLINSKPRQAMQAGKKGKFEKLYRLTTEGKKQVARRLNEGTADD